MPSNIQGQNPGRHFLSNIFHSPIALTRQPNNRESSLGPDFFRALIFGDNNVPASIYASSIGSNEALGTALATLNSFLTYTGSQEALGTCTVNLNSYYLTISSAEALGTCLLTLNTNPSGIASNESVNQCLAELLGLLGGIGSQESCGTSRVQLSSYLSQIISQEGLGTPYLSFSIQNNGISSLEALGTCLAGLNSYLAGILPGSIGTPTLSAVDIFIELQHHGYVQNIHRLSPVNGKIPDLLPEPRYNVIRNKMPSQIGKVPQLMKRKGPKLL